MFCVCRVRLIILLMSFVSIFHRAYGVKVGGYRFILNFSCSGLIRLYCGKCISRWLFEDFIHFVEFVHEGCRGAFAFVMKCRVLKLRRAAHGLDSVPRSSGYWHEPEVALRRPVEQGLHVSQMGLAAKHVFRRCVEAF